MNPANECALCLRGLACDDIILTCTVCSNTGFCYNCFCDLCDVGLVVGVPEWINGNLVITIIVLCIPEILHMHEYTMYNPYE